MVYSILSGCKRPGGGVAGWLEPTRGLAHGDHSTQANDGIPMRAGLTRGLPFVLACASALAQVGCGAAPPAAGSPAPAAVPVAEPQGHPNVDQGRALPALRLDPLFAERPPLHQDPRNPFRFGPAGEETARRSPSQVVPPGAPEPPSGGPSLPLAEPTAAAPDAPGGTPAPLRLIGVVEARESAGRVAVLTDERGVYHGRAGDAVEGRYRIVAIDETSVELEDLARGVRMTLRLSGF